jgi:hypothetical protein
VLAAREIFEGIKFMKEEFNQEEDVGNSFESLQ